MRIGKYQKNTTFLWITSTIISNYGLLVPPKPRGQYVFDGTDCQGSGVVLGLKELDFSLREIHVILSLKRISGLADPQDMKN